MLDPVITSEGVAVVHLFCTRSPGTDDEAVIAAVKAAQADDVQVVTVAVLGHKAELCFMALHPDSWKLRDLQTGLANAGLVVVDSFVSITEVSEYAQGVPEEMKNMRLYPELPPEGKSAWCFYPMTKRRGRAQLVPTRVRRSQGAAYEHGVGTTVRRPDRAAHHCQYGPR